MHVCYIGRFWETKDARAFFRSSSFAVEHWKAGFAALQEFRRKLRESDGVYVRKELHATKFLTGHGRVSEKHLPLERRVEIYLECLDVISRLPEVHLFNAIDIPESENFLFERLLNRLNRAMKDGGRRAIIVSDEGKDYTRLARKMAVLNPVPSKFAGVGRW